MLIKLDENEYHIADFIYFLDLLWIKFVGD